MPTVHYNCLRLLDEMAAGSPAPVSIGEPVSIIRSNAIKVDGEHLKSGVWESSPGKWVRQVKLAEFCHFLEGDATFIPDDGSAPIEVEPGTVILFPANSGGIWDIRTTSRKIFIVFNEGIVP